MIADRLTDGPFIGFSPEDLRMVRHPSGMASFNFPVALLMDVHVTHEAWRLMVCGYRDKPERWADLWGEWCEARRRLRVGVAQGAGPGFLLKEEALV